MHWLPVHERTRFKLLLMTFKCLNQLAPSYLSDLLLHYRPWRALRSFDRELLVQPRCHLKTYGEWAFSFIAPKLWNTLPLSIKRCKSVESFKSTLTFFKVFFILLSLLLWSAVGSAEKQRYIRRLLFHYLKVWSTKYKWKKGENPICVIPWWSERRRLITKTFRTLSRASKRRNWSKLSTKTYSFCFILREISLSGETKF